MNKRLQEDGNLDDPWTYFGSFSKQEIEGAKKLLLDAGLTFEIKEEERQVAYDPAEWSGSYGLWILDEHAFRASSLLIPYFKKFR